MFILVIILIIFLLTRVQPRAIVGGNTPKTTFWVEDVDIMLGLENRQLITRLTAAGFTREPHDKPTNMSIGYVIDRGGKPLFSPIFKSTPTRFKSVIANHDTLTNREKLALLPIGSLPKTQNLRDVRELTEPMIAKYTNSHSSSGVEVVSNTAELTAFKAKYPIGVISEYINDPLLIRGYKFHFRVYLAVHVLWSGEPSVVRMYLGPEYRILTAKLPYTREYSRDSHLTNADSTSHRFVFPDDFAGVDTGKINANIRAAVANAASYLAPRSYEGKSAFEVLAFDILCDKKYNAYILECNSKVGYGPYGELDTWPQFNTGFSRRYYDWLIDAVIAPQFGLAAPLPDLLNSPCFLAPLKTLNDDEINQLAAIGSLPEIYMKIGRKKPYNAAKLRELIAYPAAIRSDYYHFAIMSNAPIGYIGMFDGRIRYFVAPGFAGKNIASTALKTLVGILAAIGIDNMSIETVNNPASERVAEKAGFKFNRTENKYGESVKIFII